MKVLILAGGLGTRISEETKIKPKPMVLIKEKPLLWHLMNIFAKQGLSDFVIATGYKSQMIEDWAENLVSSWNITTVFTGEETQTGGRIKQCIEEFSDQTFIATYGDGLANVNMKKVMQIHEQSRSIATITAVRPPARFGRIQLDGNRVTHFGEKVQADEGWINGGFFVMNREVKEFISGDSEPFETGALPRLAHENLLSAYLHEGFWQPMDTLREKIDLENFAMLHPPPWLKDL